MEFVLYGILGFVCVLILLWIINTIKAMKDPDVIEASRLRMTIDKYKYYKSISQEIQNIYSIYGINSDISYKKVNDIIKNIKNKNEWHIFMNREIEKGREESLKYFK